MIFRTLSCFTVTIDGQGCDTNAYSTGSFESSPLDINQQQLINAGPTSTTDIWVVTSIVSVHALDSTAGGLVIWECTHHLTSGADQRAHHYTHEPAVACSVEAAFEYPHNRPHTNSDKCMSVWPARPYTNALPHHSARSATPYPDEQAPSQRPSQQPTAQPSQSPTQIPSTTPTQDPTTVRISI